MWQVVRWKILREKRTPEKYPLTTAPKYMYITSGKPDT